MDIRLHYDLPNNCIVDVEIQKPKEGEGHIISILGKKGFTSLTKYVLKPVFFPELRDPQIHIHTFDLEDGEKDVLLEIYDDTEDDISVYFYLNTSNGRGTVITPFSEEPELYI